MNETSKNKSCWRIWFNILIWLTSFITIVLSIVNASSNNWAFILIVGIAGAFIPLFLLWAFSNWLSLRRALIGFAILATLAAIFYTEEDWRGKRAWENCKRELDAKGEVLDWNDYIPPTVPDDQNFFTVTTNFYLHFVKLQTAEQSEALKRVQWLNLSNGFPVLDLAKVQPVVAEIALVAPTDTIKIPGIMANDPNVRQQLQDSFRAIVGRAVNGAAGFRFSELQLSNPVPAKITLLADKPTSIGELENLIPQNLFTNIGRLAVTATADLKIFQVKFTTGRITAAVDYLTWGDRQFGADVDDVRAALKRPYAMIPGDYSEPYLEPIPNFVVMRALAQTLAQRTQCYLLLGQPDKALRELTLMHDICRILEHPPTGKPIILVEAMINVAISGLYVQIVADGMRLHGWQEPQLAAIQEQLKEINLPTIVIEAFKMEQAASSQTLITMSASEIGNIFYGNKKTAFMEKLENPWYQFLIFAPRGWIYQNMVTSARMIQGNINGVDVANELVSPRILNDVMRDVDTTFKHISPYNYFAYNTIPNFVKVWQTTAHNQTMVNEAQIACALERYHLAHDDYPETLDALAPQFMEKIPHDIIGGQPLHYRRMDDGKFLLYSVGWNEKDDGGQEPPIDFTKGNYYTEGDWVWKN
jgi:hypothetical protein